MFGGEKVFKGIEMTLTNGLIVTLFSMGVVFVTLLSISFIIDIMRILMVKKN